MAEAPIAAMKAVAERLDPLRRTVVSNLVSKKLGLRAEAARAVKFLVDAQLPPALARWLRDAGHEAEHVEDIGLRAAHDGAIWAHALKSDRSHGTFIYERSGICGSGQRRQQ